jgi:hypothetical protein
MPLRMPAPFRSSLSRLRTPIIQRRPLTTTNRLYLKEDAERSGEDIDAVKQQQLDKQKRGEGHWHEELASSGESNVKADKEHVEDHDEHIEDLQKRTENAAEKDEV